jgi:hypothetical protein
MIGWGGGVVPLPPPSRESIMNKKVWINYMLGHNKPGLDSKMFSGLLDTLGVKELRILKKHDDLIERVVEICKFTKMGLLKTIRNDYKFEIQNCQNGDVWIEGGESVEKLTPSWISKGQLPYAGWYLTFNGENDSFSPWARRILLQEVRINLWLRYMEHKIEIASIKPEKTKNPFEPATQVYGPGSAYGNYV